MLLSHTKHSLALNVLIPDLELNQEGNRLYEMNHGQDAESRVVWPEYLRIRYFPGGWSPPPAAVGVFLIINESESEWVVTQGRRISITLCIHL